MDVAARIARRWGRAVVGGALLLAGCERVPGEDFFTGGDDRATADGEDQDEAEVGAGLTPCSPGLPGDCGMGQKCTALVSAGVQNRYRCVPDDATLEPYAPCLPAPMTGQDRCPDAHVCQSGSLDGAPGLCLRLCGSALDCGPNGACVQDLATGASVCAEICDPLGADCTGGRRCLAEFPRYHCRFPGKIDVGGVDDACEASFGRGCGPGLICWSAPALLGCASTHCCTPLCGLAGPASCPSPSQCNPIFSGPPPAGMQGIGVCDLGGG